MINSLGENLLKCNLNCKGINNNPEEGIIPRGLILEKRSGKTPCIVVGLNPGMCKKNEKDYYLSHGINYSSLQNYFNESNLKNYPYFRKTRNLITMLGFDGDILWTDLVKCQSLGKNGEPPIQTIRTCANKFLCNEVGESKYTAILTLGETAFRFCAFRFTKQTVIGLSHPSSRGHFSRLKKKVESNPEYFIDQINNSQQQSIQLSKISPQT